MTLSTPTRCSGTGSSRLLSLAWSTRQTGRPTSRNTYSGNVSRGLGSRQRQVLQLVVKKWADALKEGPPYSYSWVTPWRTRDRHQSLKAYRSQVGAERRAIRRLVEMGWLVTVNWPGVVGYGDFKPPPGEPDAIDDWYMADSVRVRVHYAMSAAEALPASASGWPVGATQRFTTFWREGPWLTESALWADRRDAVDEFSADFVSRCLWEWDRQMPGVQWQWAWARWTMREMRRHQERLK